MAEAAQQHLVEIDPDFEPLSRPRSCTWPLPRPEFTNPGDSNTSSPAQSVKQEPTSNSDFISNLSLLEESEDFPEQKPIVLCNEFQCRENCIHQQPSQHQQQLPSPQLPHQQQVPMVSPPVGSASSVAAAAAAAAQRKSSSSRRNAWGNMSYADLITKAIESSPEKRLTLSQIYDWMVKSVPYFKDKGDSNSSAGWKNSIRHNLSLHSRFVRVQNEGTGKSSWWMLNPDGGKNGKSPRRRAASMDNNSKFTKSRGRAAKKKLALQGGPDGGGGGGGGADSPGSSYSKWPGSPNSHSNDDFDAWSVFRPRTGSNASTLSGRLSPFMPEQDDLLGDGDMHMVYPGGPQGPKMTATLPSLSEMTGPPLGRHGHGHGAENVMEDLLDNLNLLSPKNPQGGGVSGGSAQSSPSAAMMQGSPGYSPYSSPPPSMGGHHHHGPPPPAAPPQQDYRKCLYGQAGGGMSGMAPVAMPTMPEAKPVFGNSVVGGPYGCPAGLLKELLTSDSDPRGELMPPVDAAVSQPGGGGGGVRMLPPYGGGAQHGAKLMRGGGGGGGGGGGAHPHPHPHPHPHGLARPHPHAHAIHSQAPPTSVALNGRTLMSLSAASHHGVYGLSAHLGGGVGGLTGGYCPLGTNGYGRPGLAPPPPHAERLPSDLDDMSIERFECDMESILHDTLMDGDSLDFNFEPVVPQQGGFSSHGVKTTTHSWVSG